MFQICSPPLICVPNISAVQILSQADRPACADPGAETSIGTSKKCILLNDIFWINILGKSEMEILHPSIVDCCLQGCNTLPIWVRDCMGFPRDFSLGCSPREIPRKTHDISNSEEKSNILYHLTWSTRMELIFQWYIVVNCHSFRLLTKALLQLNRKGLKVYK